MPTALGWKGLSRLQTAERTVPGYGWIVLTLEHQHDMDVLITSLVFPEGADNAPEQIEREFTTNTMDEAKHLCQEVVDRIEAEVLGTEGTSREQRSE